MSLLPTPEARPTGLTRTITPQQTITQMARIPRLPKAEPKTPKAESQLPKSAPQTTIPPKTPTKTPTKTATKTTPQQHQAARSSATARTSCSSASTSGNMATDLTWEFVNKAQGVIHQQHDPMYRRFIAYYLCDKTSTPQKLRKAFAAMQRVAVGSTAIQQMVITSDLMFTIDAANKKRSQRAKDMRARFNAEAATARLKRHRSSSSSKDDHKRLTSTNNITADQYKTRACSEKEKLNKQAFLQQRHAAPYPPPQVTRKASMVPALFGPKKHPQQLRTSSAEARDHRTNVQPIVLADNKIYNTQPGVKLQVMQQTATRPLAARTRSQLSSQDIDMDVDTPCQSMEAIDIDRSPRL
jgi:hypothetical protein